MENLKYRKGAKIVAIVDLIITCVMLWAVAMLFFLIVGIFTAASNQTKVPSENNDFNDIEQDFESANDRKTFMFVATLAVISFIVFLVLEILEIVAAIKLLNSTQLGIDYADAAKKARFWRNITIAFVVFGLLGSMARGRRGMSLQALVVLILRIVGIYIVHNFIKQLDLAATLPRTHVVYSSAPGGEILAPGAVVLTMNPPQQQSGFYPNLPPVSQNLYPDPPKYSDVVEKR